MFSIRTVLLLFATILTLSPSFWQDIFCKTTTVLESSSQRETMHSKLYLEKSHRTESRKPVLTYQSEILLYCRMYYSIIYLEYISPVCMHCLVFIRFYIRFNIYNTSSCLILLLDIKCHILLIKFFCLF